MNLQFKGNLNIYHIFIYITTDYLYVFLLRFCYMYVTMVYIQEIKHAHLIIKCHISK
jgi:hypothetical protein